MSVKEDNGLAILDLCIKDDHFEFATDIVTALDMAYAEKKLIEVKITEDTESINKLKAECDKLDYILAAACGALCGVMDVFLVGKPGESPVGNISDEWFGNRTKDFAKLCGWDGNGGMSSAIKQLEDIFKIPYDQHGAGDRARGMLLTPKNHHFKSLGHNPNLLGLFFSILDQFDNTSHFISDGELISLQHANDSFELRGSNVSSKIFYGFANWFGHLISDVSGSSASKGRGMGIPSPFWSWTNDVIAIKKKLNIPVNEFDKNINELALQIYKEGYDARFQAAQAIPVFVNEVLVRLIYSTRRLIQYLSNVKKEKRSFNLMWESCEPFKNATVKRMLTVAHGTFCLIDTSDAVIRGIVTGAGAFNVSEFAMRLNIVGIGRFTISLYGEATRGYNKAKKQEEVYFLRSEKVIVDDYISGLLKLSEVYDDKELLIFVDDFKKSDAYKEAFDKTIILAQKRGVPSDKILSDKSAIDTYFGGK